MGNGIIMAFRIEIHSIPLRSDGMDLGSIAIPFLVSIGYFHQGYEQKRTVNIFESTPYKIFAECFIKKRGKIWRIGEIARYVKTSIPTVYRHVEKLKEMDLICEYPLENNPSRRGLALRYFNIVDAWKFTELNVKMTLKRYRKVVEHISDYFPSEMTGDVERKGDMRPLEFTIQLTDRVKVSDSIDKTVLNFLVSVDYISEPEGSMLRTAKRSIPYRLFRECLIPNAARMWSVEDIAQKLRTTKPTVYRHLKKLEYLAIMERVVHSEKGVVKKSYRIRYGNLSKAWGMTEEYVNMYMKKYGDIVNAINGFMEG